MARKIALFSCGWAFDLLHDYAKGVVKRMQGLDVDLYMFVCYPPYVDSEIRKIGELNIFNLPYIEDFDGVLILGNAIDHVGVYEQLIERCKEANVPVYPRDAKMTTHILSAVTTITVPRICIRISLKSTASHIPCS